jgi:uncharacterized protein YeaO (DUF488 family)
MPVGVMPVGVMPVGVMQAWACAAPRSPPRPSVRFVGEMAEPPADGRDATPAVSVVRVYEDPGRRRAEYRVLVDRLWPRGKTKESVDADEWVKEIAPSDSLRRWYGHDLTRFAEFARRYRHELASFPAADAVDRLIDKAKKQPLVLLTATREVDRSHARVLKDVLVAKARDEK